MLETAKLVMLRVFLLRLMLLRSCQMEEKMSREARQLGGYPQVFLSGGVEGTVPGTEHLLLCRFGEPKHQGES